MQFVVIVTRSDDVISDVTTDVIAVWVCLRTLVIHITSILDVQTKSITVS